MGDGHGEEAEVDEKASEDGIGFAFREACWIG